MKDLYIGQWFRCQIGFGKVMSKLGHSWNYHEHIRGKYRCVIFGKTTLVTDIDSKDIKSLKFLDCPEYYNVMILYGYSN